MPLGNYTPTHWEDADSTETPINAANLNNIENGIEALTAAVQALEQTLQTIPAKATAAQVESETDSGYVTPAQVGEVIDNIFKGNAAGIGALKYSNGKLVYTDKSGMNHIIWGQQ